jgi:hypothetical protein
MKADLGIERGQGSRHGLIKADVGTAFTRHRASRASSRGKARDLFYSSFPSGRGGGRPGENLGVVGLSWRQPRDGETVDCRAVD